MIGPLEGMHIIIRSRLWLFPGVLGKSMLKRRRRSEVEREHRKKQWALMENAKAADSNYIPDNPDDLKFQMGKFLRRCQFPEFRVLFRAFDLFGFSDIKNIKNLEAVDALTKQCQKQVFKTFPVLDMLDTGGSIISILNPANHIRILKNINALRMGERKPVDPSTFKFDETPTRYEEIEKDDVTKNLDPDWWDRHEPQPWGTLRLMVGQQGACFCLGCSSALLMEQIIMLITSYTLPLLIRISRAFSLSLSLSLSLSHVSLDRATSNLLIVFLFTTLSLVLKLIERNNSVLGGGRVTGLSGAFQKFEQGDKHDCLLHFQLHIHGVRKGF